MPIKLAVNSCEKRCEIFFSKKLNLIFLKPSIVITRKHDLGKWERMARRNNKNWEKERDEASHVCFFFLPPNRCSQRPFLLYGKRMCVCVCVHTQRSGGTYFTLDLLSRFVLNSLLHSIFFSTFYNHPCICDGEDGGSEGE